MPRRDVATLRENTGIIAAFFGILRGVLQRRLFPRRNIRLCGRLFLRLLGGRLVVSGLLILGKIKEIVDLLRFVIKEDREISRRGSFGGFLLLDGKANGYPVLECLNYHVPFSSYGKWRCQWIWKEESASCGK